MINKTAIPQRNDNITEKILGDEMILYNKTTHSIHSLNQTASILWNLCDGEASINEMLTHLFEAFKGDKKVIEHDTLNTLEDMKQNNLLTF